MPKFAVRMLVSDNNVNWYGMSNTAILREVGLFIKNLRIEKNISQGELAEKAGISRTTLYMYEKGHAGSFHVLIQLLRALDHLEALDVFVLKKTPSPLMVADYEAKMRKRASSPNRKTRKK